MADERSVITVGSCRPEYLPRISKILEGAPGAASWSTGALASALTSATDPFLVAWHGNELVGFILGRMIGSEAEILNLAVKEEFRRRGVASALVKAMLVACELNRCTRVWLEVRESNREAIALYERWGFEQVGRRTGYYRDPVEAALILARGTCPKG